MYCAVIKYVFRKFIKMLKQLHTGKINMNLNTFQKFVYCKQSEWLFEENFRAMILGNYFIEQKMTL